MDANKIKDADILDIIFDGRNKEYGAYQLRKTYSGRLLTGLAVMIGAVLLVFIGSVIANAKKDSKTEILVQDVNLADVKQQEEPKPEPPPPPPPPKVEPPKIEITKFTPPKIVKDEEVKPEDEIKQQDELDNTTIGKINQEGIKTDVVAPPVEEKGTGTVEAPKVEEDYDKEFKTVQIEAKFPGGLGEWKRFLERNLNRDVPIDNGAPVGNYTVVVSFLVDKDGNVSEVRAENNPGYGTSEEAVRVIKRGPKWTPAVQNGRNVIYRQKQTITFQVSEE